ncbi:hypothetical protein IE53DRAFT_364650 [Violaceomyces palustris]|uniref:Uncharacterized protein n=1 Tax=Violaceomyces palustris TaxID=1673888 RepID=A0ACD0NNS7_9BASI|nr:hypothetical protein IE53DRAFT_364650 [Violaceomyces palustris]
MQENGLEVIWILKERRPANDPSRSWILMFHHETRSAKVTRTDSENPRERSSSGTIHGTDRLAKGPKDRYKDEDSSSRLQSCLINNYFPQQSKGLLIAFISNQHPLPRQTLQGTKMRPTIRFHTLLVFVLSTSSLVFSSPSSLANGEPCLRDSDCVSNFCSIDTKQCSGRMELGSDCTRSRQCKSDYCSPSPDSKCLNKKGRGIEGDFCLSNYECMPQLFCCDKGEQGEGKECKVKVELGGQCSTSTSCKSGICSSSSQRCVPGDGKGLRGDYCTIANQCSSGMSCNMNACREKQELGGDCKVRKDCSSGFCYKDKCVPIKGMGQVGDYCNATSQCSYSSSSVEAYCSSKSNKCMVKGDLGQDCESSTSCKSGVCSVVTSKCVGTKYTAQDGSYCTSTMQCLQTSFCEANVCKKRMAGM